MPTQNLIVRTPADLREMAEARAARDGCNVSDVARSALRAYLTGDDGDPALRRALHRAEAKCKRLEEELAAARQGGTVAAQRQARVAARKARDERFAAALEAATFEDPVTVSRLSAVSGFTADWCRDLLRALCDAEYAGTVAPGRWVPEPGRDIREGIRAAKALAERGPARTGPRYRDGGDLAPAADVTSALTVPFREPGQ